MSTKLQKIYNAQTKGNKEIEDIKEELEILKAERDNLLTIRNEKVTEYNQTVKDGKSEEERDKAYEASELADAEYKEKRKEVEEKEKELENKKKEVKENVKRLKPEYVEKEWKETVDGNFQIDNSNYTSDQAIVLWAKLVMNGETSYNEEIYTVSGTKAPTVDVTGVNLNSTEVSIVQGSKYKLVASIVPSDATNTKVSWTSSNEQIATVNNGEINALKEGQAVITAKTEDGEFTATCKVTVTKAKEETENNKEDDKTVQVTGVSLNKSQILLLEEEKYELSATITPNNATNKNVNWSSSNEKVATVKDGKITAIKEGEATITATTEDGSYTDTCKVTVNKKKVADPTVTPDSQMPQTGNSPVLIGVLIVSVILCVVIYKKNKSIKF